MKSIIFEYVNNDGDECTSIWSPLYFDKTRRNCKQIICALQWSHSKEDWQLMVNATQEDLLRALTNAIRNNPKYVLYPN